jgi:hypothetical protein
MVSTNSYINYVLLIKLQKKYYSNTLQTKTHEQFFVFFKMFYKSLTSIP